MATKIQLRRDTSSNWAILNVVLSSGEIGFEIDTNKFKIGNGSTVWADLPYFSEAQDLSAYATTSSLNSGIVSASAAAVSYLVDSAPGALDTLNELAAALGDDANYASTITTALGNKLDISSASTTYLTQSSASTTYLSKNPQLQLIDTQVFNSSGTYVVPEGAVEVKVESISAGAGGASGYAQKITSGTSFQSGHTSGGDGGSYYEIIKKISELSSGSAVSVVIGSGGLGAIGKFTDINANYLDVNLPTKGGNNLFDGIVFNGATVALGSNKNYYPLFYNQMYLSRIPAQGFSTQGNASGGGMSNYKGGGYGGRSGGNTFATSIFTSSKGGKSSDVFDEVFQDGLVTNFTASGSAGVGSLSLSPLPTPIVAASNPGDGGPGGGIHVGTSAGSYVGGNGGNGISPGGGGGAGGSAVCFNATGDATAGNGGNGGNGRITVKAYGYI